MSLILTLNNFNILIKIILKFTACCFIILLVLSLPVAVANFYSILSGLSNMTFKLRSRTMAGVGTENTRPEL